MEFRPNGCVAPLVRNRSPFPRSLPVRELNCHHMLALTVSERATLFKYLAS